MPIQNIRKNKGSALLLVVIVTVLLSVIGIIFVMTMRIREMTTSNAADDRDLNTAVGAVTEKIETVLRQDLFGTNLKSGILSTNSANSYGADPWLASLEPDPATWTWPYITNLSGGTAIGNQPILIIPDYQTPVAAGNAGDADGDGVSDSRWFMLSNISTSRGKPVFAAVRIIDNCAMLNLNTAYCFYHNTADPNSPFSKPWYMNSIAAGNVPPVPYGDNPTVLGQKYYYRDGGKYLSELNYLPMLRGSDLNAIFATLDGAGATGDNWYGILGIRKFNIKPLSSPAVPYTPQEVHELGIMQIENPGPTFSAFDIGDELEIRNRFIMTSLAESRFERHDAANYTLDSGGGVYAALRIPRDSGSHPFSDWTVRMNPANFDLWRANGTMKVSGDPDYSDSYKYDRRHVCTFYSFDRNIRTGDYSNLDGALLLQPALEPFEEVFRPLHHLPVDLRAMTDTTKPDNIISPDLGTNPDTGIPYLVSAHRNILHLLYAFQEREYYALTKTGGPDPNALIKAARKAAQQVANIIDYLDDDTIDSTGPFGYVPTTDPVFGNPAYGLQINDKPTYINKAIIDAMLAEVSLAYNGTPIVPTWPYYSSIDFGLPAGEVVYGLERQPFISEVYCNYNPVGGAQGFALELLNPYADAINLSKWRITIGSTNYPLTATSIVPGGSSTSPGRLVISAGTINPALPPLRGSQTIAGFGLGTVLNGNVMKLQRPKPDVANTFMTVDETDLAQTTFLMGGSVGAGDYVSSREDTGWKFTNKTAFVDNHTATLGSANGVTSARKGYQLPVDNVGAPIDRLADFQKIAWVDPNNLTTRIANASDEGSIRFDTLRDFINPPDLELLSYVCTLSREGKGIPGRVNINTAPVQVIAAAIPPQLVINGVPKTDPNYVDALTLAQDIIANRPYARLVDLLKVPAMEGYVSAGAPDVGDQQMKNDFEERDWIFNRLSNIFTVRSDTFTAYILVRLGTDGPQRRMIAIFDRSNCWTAADKPKLVALHPVPDPR